MCGRYVLADGEILGERFIARGVPRIPPSFNVAPTQRMPIVRVGPDGGRTVDLLRWGIVPAWGGRDGKSAPPLFNARSETVAEKQSFRNLLSGQRCLVPANGFYEWSRQGGSKRPYYFSVKDSPLFAFAGLYTEAAGEDRPAAYTILTTSPNDLLARYHNRMPVILRPEDEIAWLDPDETEPLALEHCYTPFPAEEMAVHAANPAVNNVRNNDPSMLDETPEA
jgi:putative SOS response-associated peptidase YedK